MQKSAKSMGVFFLFLSIVSFLVSCSSPESSKFISRHIVGSVTDKTNGSAIESALIELEFMNTRVLASTHTDKDGYYSLHYNGKPLDPPTLDVRVIASGYAGDFEHIKNTSDTQTINFQLNPWD
jgi:hypothetical protein